MNASARQLPNSARVSGLEEVLVSGAEFEHTCAKEICIFGFFFSVFFQFSDTVLGLFLLIGK